MVDFNGVGWAKACPDSILGVTDGPPHMVSEMVEAGESSVALLVCARHLRWPKRTRQHCDTIDDVQQCDAARLPARILPVTIHG